MSFLFHFFLEKPETPEVILIKNKAMLKWIQNSNGDLVQYFEIWFRPMSQTDYDWKVVETNITSYHIPVNKFDRWAKVYFCVRARNSESYSDFSTIIKVSQMFDDLHVEKLSSLNGKSMYTPSINRV